MGCTQEAKKWKILLKKAIQACVMALSITKDYRQGCPNIASILFKMCIPILLFRWAQRLYKKEISERITQRK